MENFTGENGYEVTKNYFINQKKVIRMDLYQSRG